MTTSRPFPADLPGVTVEWLARANNCSARSIRRWRSSLPPDDAAASEFLACLTQEVALQMLAHRPTGGVLPLWSRMALTQLALGGASYAELARRFGVGRSTVYRAIRNCSAGYCPISGYRQINQKVAKQLQHSSTICRTARHTQP